VKEETATHFQFEYGMITTKDKPYLRKSFLVDSVSNLLKERRSSHLILVQIQRIACRLSRRFMACQCCFGKSPMRNLGVKGKYLPPTANQACKVETRSHASMSHFFINEGDKNKKLIREKKARYMGSVVKE